MGVLGIIAFFVWFARRNQVSTNDAYTGENVVTMAPQVSGYVVALYVNKVGPNFVPPKDPVPGHYAGAPIDSVDIGGPQPSADAAPESFWWREFQDVELNRLVDQITAGNLDLQAAYPRIVEARIQVQAARARGLPSLNGTASFTREQLGLAGIRKSQKAFPPGSATSVHHNATTDRGARAPGEYLSGRIRCAMETRSVRQGPPKPCA